MEDKQKICNLLCETLQNTRNLSDLAELLYDNKSETVTAVFENGGKKVVNVALDSGTALIKDVMAHIV